MCWEGNRNRKNIANNDILCYKILKRIENSSELISEYFTFVYELKKLYKTQICTRRSWIDDDKIYIYEGFHSYSENVVIKLHNYKSNATVSVSYGHRLYSHDFINCKPVLVECTIPKGSIYYENKYGEIVSNKIIIEKEINWHLKQL